MNRVGRKLEYSLMALKLLSQKQSSGTLVSAKEVAEACHIPFDVTARVLQVMAQNSVLNVEHGSLGGYQINRDLKSLSLQDLLTMIQGPTEIAKCLQSKREPCEVEGYCNIVQPIQHLNHKLNQFYQSLPVAEVLGL
jgi:Rrf2 family protein